MSRTAKPEQVFTVKICRTVVTFATVRVTAKTAKSAMSKASRLATHPAASDPAIPWLDGGDPEVEAYEAIDAQGIPTLAPDPVEDEPEATADVFAA